MEYMDESERKRAAELDAQLSPDMWRRINTANSTITASDGTILRYELFKVRKWNVGLKRHVMELTGEITVYSADESTYRVEPCWSDAIMRAESYQDACAAWVAARTARVSARFAAKQSRHPVVLAMLAAAVEAEAAAWERCRSLSAQGASA